jgi:hypothetical protein
MLSHRSARIVDRIALVVALAPLSWLLACEAHLEGEGGPADARVASPRDGGPVERIDGDVRDGGSTPDDDDAAPAPAPDDGGASPALTEDGGPADVPIDDGGPAAEPDGGAGPLPTVDAGRLPSPTATLLFRSGFELPVSLDDDGEVVAVEATRGVDSFLRGSDALGFSWPIEVLGTGRGESAIRMISGNHRNTLAEGAGPDGSRALELYTESCSFSGCQNDLQIYPDAAHANLPVYFRYDLRLQPGLAASLGEFGYRTIAFFKTGTGYRVELYVYTDRDGNAYWHVHGDTIDDTGNPQPGTDSSGRACVETGARYEYWAANNYDVPIPEGRWVPIEIMWARGDRDDGEGGRFYFSVDGQIVFDEHRSLWPSMRDGTPYCGDPSRTFTAGPIGWLAPFMVYSNAGFPRHQTVDNFEIWDGFPCADAPCVPD